MRPAKRAAGRRSAPRCTKSSRRTEPGPFRRSGAPKEVPVRGKSIECGFDNVMRCQPSTRSVDRLIAALAERQDGVVARWQLLQAGLTARQIELRLESGRLHEIHRGIYLVGHKVPPPLAVEQAALLACGEAAVLSHRSAANLWNLLAYPASAPVWVTVPPGRSAARPGLRTKRANLARRDIRTRHGLRLTSPPRTILDLSPLLDEDALESVVAEAQYRRLASQRELSAQVQGSEGKRGVVKLRGCSISQADRGERGRGGSARCFACFVARA